MLILSWLALAGLRCSYDFDQPFEGHPGPPQKDAEGEAEAGTDGTTDADGECTTGASRCDGSVPQICEGGTWQSGAPCSFVCVDGACGGECLPGATRCSGQLLESCNTAGEWEGTPCAFACSQGACSDMPPSCAGMAGVECQGTSCCSTRFLPGGSLLMGRSANGADAFAGEDDELPEHPATVAEFFLDSFEVTVGRFRRFVEQFDGTPPSEGAAAHPLIEDSGWEASWDSNLPTSTGALASHAACNPSLRTWTDTPGSRETHPVNCVTWYTAFAFCAWDGGRLPTEAEWEFAAAGGEENRLYPWGQQPPDMTRSGFDCGWGGTSGQCTLSDLGAVGSTPAGEARWGHQDLAGSLWEYVLDRHSDAWYAGPGNPCDNCANLAMGMARAIRGGSFQHPSSSLRAANRTFKEPDIPGITIGFRCARNAE